MVYEYANRFVDRGHMVSIYYVNLRCFARFYMPKFIKKELSNIFTLFEPWWFKLDSRIKKISGSSRFGEKNAKECDADVVIATAADTFEFVDNLFEKCKKAYFIQDYEYWALPEKQLLKTYTTPAEKIVISNWLKEKVDQYSPVEAVVIRNPIDRTKYRVITGLNKRSKHSVGFLYHIKEHKGVKHVLSVIKRLKQEYPDLECHAFGQFEVPSDFPSYINYTKNATEKETIKIYNSVRVFICGTIKEGFGLTGLEAMACGAVLVSTDYLGVHEYANHMENALLSPVNDENGLFQNVKKEFENDELARKLSERGVKSVESGFDWDIACERFLETIKGNDGCRG